MKYKIKEFLKRKGIELSLRRYFIDAMSAMAMGLFSSLLIGTILNTIGIKFNIAFLTNTVWPICRDMTGACIGIAIAHALNAHTFVLFSAAVVGFAGNSLGGPIGAFCATIISTELGKAVSRETKIDLIVTPAITIISGTLAAALLGQQLNIFMTWLGSIIINATELSPFCMGMLVSVLVGVILTLPISSAAICMMLSLSGLAGGAATVGCCAQMIGFAVMSYKDNGLGGVFAVGIGTSMLHMPNIIKKPIIWLPPTLTAALLGPLSTLVFKMENIPIGAGMGTCGFVGQISTLTAMGASFKTYIGIILLHFVLPSLFTILFTHLLVKFNLIKKGDLKLNI